MTTNNPTQPDQSVAEQQIREQITPIVDMIRDWVHDELDGTSLVKIKLKQLDVIENTAVAQLKALLLDAQHQVLTELQEWEQQWHDTHLSTEPFNYYGAIKAMQVMKEPRKPFHVLQQTRQEEVRG